MKRKKRRKNSSTSRRTQNNNRDTSNPVEKFLNGTKKQLGSPRATFGPLSYGSGDWTYRVWRQGAKISIIFQYGRVANTVRLAIDYDSLNGYIAFQSGKPQLLGGGFFQVNGNPRAEGNRLFALFLRFIDEGADVDEVFIEIADFASSVGLHGVSIADLEQDVSTITTELTPEDRWEALESELEAK